ncbi:hypothetical protein AB1Y20_016097 [Prymnesium parvum]|uniref:Uncharacterized protein n=1 Tax=Prymnesium parvum TaxID=97485 RepID=A0AB34K3B1_PRYPA
METDSLLQSIFNTIPARARFVGRYLAYTTFSSLSTGFVFGQLGATLCTGPLVPFMSGAWLGYTFACFSFFRLEAQRAMEYIRKYPHLMEHAIEVEFKNLADLREGEPVEEWVRSGGLVVRLGRLSWAILAAQGCSTSVDEIQEARRQRLVQSCDERSKDD